jgi:hypothetical protein
VRGVDRSHSPSWRYEVARYQLAAIHSQLSQEPSSPLLGPSILTATFLQDNDSLPALQL